MSLLDYLGIKTVKVTASETVIAVKVTAELMQPFGIVHGGVNATLAETAASLGANCWLKEHLPDYNAVGLNITTQHLLPVREGQIRAVARPVHCGRRIQSWQVWTYNQQRLTSQSLVTLVNNKSQGRS